MNEIIYLEPDEDITGVIARVKSISSKGVSLVIPRGGTIAQSIVNLKLLKREIEKMGKVVSLVSKDKISKNLASQVGVTVYHEVAAAKNARAFDMSASAEKEAENLPAGDFKINRYVREDEEDFGSEALDQKESPSNVEESSHNESPDTTDENAEHENRDNLEGERVAMATAKPIPRVAKRDEAAEDERVAPAKKTVVKKLKPILIIAGIFVILALVGAVILLPSAEAKVTLATNDLSISNMVTIDKSVSEADVDAMTMPATEYSMDESSQKQFEATGTKDIGTKASGEVTIYNDYDPVNSVNLSAGTVFSSAGKSFVLESAVSVPPATIISLYPLKTTAGQIKGRLVASENGDSYNLAPSKFVISAYSGVKQEKIYAESSSAFTGGMTKNVKVVMQSDIDNAKQAMEDELMATAKDDLSKKAEAESLKLVASSIAGNDMEFSPSNSANDQVDNFTIKLSIKVTELAFEEAALKNLVFKKVEAGLAENEMLVNPDNSAFSYDITGADAEKGTASFSTQFDGKVGKKINSAQIIDILSAAKYGSAESKVEEIDGVKSAEVIIFPKFWPMMPLLKQRIKVSFDYQK